MSRKIKKRVALLLVIFLSAGLYFNTDAYAEEKSGQNSQNKQEMQETPEPQEPEILTGWNQFDGLWYFYDDEGVYQTSCYVEGYWLDEDGAWRYPYQAYWHGGPGNWWYGDDSGWYAYNCWLKIDGDWYYFDAFGYMCYNCYIGACYLNDNGVYTDTENSRWAANISDSELAGYFSNSVVVGDSICSGFSMYCSGSGDPVANQFTFMASTSFGINNALTFHSTTPTYMGVKRPIWESIARSGASHVYISMGINDIGSDIFASQYESLISKIVQYSPGIEVTVCGVTGIRSGRERWVFTNANVNYWNAQLRAMCIRNGYGFIDLNSWVTDGYGLYAGYCSDGFVHQNSAAYSRWLEAFKSYGRAELVKYYD